MNNISVRNGDCISTPVCIIPMQNIDYIFRAPDGEAIASMKSYNSNHDPTDIDSHNICMGVQFDDLLERIRNYGAFNND